MPGVSENALEIVQIVPRLAPTVTGVGDYALLIAEELRRAHGISTRFIVGDPHWDGPANVNRFSVAKVAARSANDLVRSLAEEPGMQTPVLLHYVGYGYQKRGCPIWLVRGLAQWRSGAAERRLFTMFHELYAS